MSTRTSISSSLGVSESLKLMKAPSVGGEWRNYSSVGRKERMGVKRMEWMERVGYPHTDSSQTSGSFEEEKPGSYDLKGRGTETS